MQRATRKNEVTVHLKLERDVRQKVLGTLHYQGITMQEFFEGLMQALAADPSRLADIQAFATGCPRRTADVAP